MTCNFGTSSVSCADRTTVTSRRSTNGYASNLIQDPHLWNLHGLPHGLDHGHLSLKTYTRTEPVESPRVSAQLRPWAPVVAQQTGMPTTLSENCTCGISTVFCAVWIGARHNDGHVNLAQELHPVESPRATPPSGSGTDATTGISSVSKDCNCGISTGYIHCLERNEGQGHNLVQEPHLENLSGMLRSLPRDRHCRSWEDRWRCSTTGEACANVTADAVVTYSKRERVVPAP